MVVGKADEPDQHNSYDDHGKDYKVAWAAAGRYFIQFAPAYLANSFVARFCG
jgi:hypothetical protein